MGSYLITGGAGFIGSHLAERLLREGHQVAVLDDLSTGNLENLRNAMRFRTFEFVKGSVLTKALVRPLVANADAVYHLAATVGVLQIMEHPVDTIANNVRGTQAILEAAVPGQQKVVITSTSEVYGKATDVPFLESGNLVLGSTCNVRWGYAASKIVDECLARGFLQEFNVPTIVVRPFNTIGPRQVGAYGMVVPRLMQQALLGQDLTVYGNGAQTRCFTYVDDAVEWLTRLVNIESAVGEVFNLGNPHEVSIRTLAEEIIRITKSTSRIRYIPYHQAYGEGFEDMERRIPSCDKIVAISGYAPSVGLEEALKRIHRWMHAKASSSQEARAQGAA